MIGHSLANADGVLLEIDERVTDLLQRPRASVIGRSYTTITHPADIARSLRRVAALKADAGATFFRKRYLRADGETLWAMVQASRLGSTGQIIGTFTFDPAPLTRDPYRLRRTISDLLSAEARRRDYLGPALASNPGWILLLHIYLAEAEGRSIGLDELERASGFSGELAARWMAVLEAEDLIEIAARPDGKRQLTPAGIERIEHVLGGGGA